jgi:hypothetical protein
VKNYFYAFKRQKSAIYATFVAGSLFYLLKINFHEKNLYATDDHFGYLLCFM